jgi:flavodoxin
VTVKPLIILISIHHQNTQKIANVIAGILDAPVVAPSKIGVEEIDEYNLIGFGSGIYDEKHHRSLLDLADRLPHISNKKAFLFSTSGVTTGSDRFHAPLREKLQSKGYQIVGEFNCNGFNTNSFLKYFGGMNKGRPNAEDLRKAEEFALGLMR